jgi:hypothetical protein
MEAGQKILAYLATLAWPVAISIIAVLFYKTIKSLSAAVVSRFESDDVIKIGFLEFRGARIQRGAITGVSEGRDLFDDDAEVTAATKDDFDCRKNIRYQSRFVRLVHKVSLTGDKKYPYEVLAYLKIEKILPELDQDSDALQGRMNDIDFVEYYLGKYFGEGEWGSWFTVRSSENAFAIMYWTYDEVTCIARVHFHDHSVVELHRYLDVEMGSMLGRLSRALKEKDEELLTEKALRLPAKK